MSDETLKQNFLENEDNIIEEQGVDENDISECAHITSYTTTYTDMINDLEKKNRKSIPFLTKYEKSRIIGIRAQQLSQNMPSLVDTTGLNNPIEIALKELKEQKLPFIIRRNMPNGTYEDWRVDELKFDSF